jgi:cytochrome bd-type quinol oxidase subunit 2
MVKNGPASPIYCLTIQEVAADSKTLHFMPSVTVIVLPIVLIYITYTYQYR